MSLTKLGPPPGRLCSLLLVAALLVACGASQPSTSCTSSTECSGSAQCIDGRCQPRLDGSAGPIRDAGRETCSEPCGGDTHCVGGACVAFGEGEIRTCTATPRPFAVSPRTVCHWPPPGRALDEGPEAWRFARRVAGTVVAAPFETSSTEFGLPTAWAVFATTGPGSADPPSAIARESAVLRVLDLESCQLVDTLDEEEVTGYYQSAAIADLDGDGVPEIIAQTGDETLLGGHLAAWRWDPELRRFRVIARSTVEGVLEADVGAPGRYVMVGPTVADLDDDGAPEIVLQGRVYDASLRRLTGPEPPGGRSFTTRPDGPWVTQLDVVRDLDRDGRAEWVAGHGIYTWRGAELGWVQASFFRPEAPLGLAHGVPAELGGAFDEGPDDGRPEIVAVGYDGVRIQSIDGRVLRRFELPTSERGGSPPSIADVDGDGVPEIMVGVDRGLFVYDLECDADPMPAGCGVRRGGGSGPLPRGVRWSDEPPDDAIDFMGATAFDFDGDGTEEVIYADECFLRIYEGATGRVVYSHWRPSSTASEVPVVIGTERGATASVVVGTPSAAYCFQAATPDRDWDTQFAGTSCIDDRDCFGGAACEGSLCRCARDSDCCASGACASEGLGCRPSDDARGDVCRAIRIPDTSPHGTSGSLGEGLDVLSDAFGRWTPARPAWPVDAYAPEMFDDVARPRRTRDVAPIDDASRFRGNLAAADLASTASDLRVRAITCDGTRAEVEICNRGQRAAPGGVEVRFEHAVGICEARTDLAIAPGTCRSIPCEASSGPIAVTIDPRARVPECDGAEGNRVASSCP